jgi:hypothetical protein
VEATGSRIIKYGKIDAEFSIWNVADQHFMNRGVAKGHIEKDIEEIRSDPYSLWFGGGDYCDWISPGDKRFDAAAFDVDIRAVDLSELASLAASKIINWYSPIKRKCLGFCLGNHEWKYMSRNSAMYVHKDICKELKAPNMFFSGWADLYFVHERGFKGVQSYYSPSPPLYYQKRLRTFVCHGKGAAVTVGGKMASLKQIVDVVYDADLVLTAHLHEQISKPFVKMTTNKNCDEIKQKITMALVTGTYLKTYSADFVGYGEMKMYPPTMIGASKAIFIPNINRLKTENVADGVGRGMNE